MHNSARVWCAFCVELLFLVSTSLCDDVSQQRMPECQAIPSSFELCGKMRWSVTKYPNFFGHQSVDEAINTSLSLVTLEQSGCHSDLGMFLCSLLTPMCLQAEILPCESLCSMVKSACTPTINEYGHSWPDILTCDQFPKHTESRLCLQPTEAYQAERSNRAGRLRRH